MEPKLQLLVTGIGMGVLGFAIGQMDLHPDKDLQASVIQPSSTSEISLIQMKSIRGDSLQVNVSGPVRILWGGENLVEGDGEYEIPLPQIPNENDLALKEFAFTGNANTMKFYPSESHFARCVAVEDRRLFSTKEEAVGAGFEPSKSVKD